MVNLKKGDRVILLPRDGDDPWGIPGPDYRKLMQGPTFVERMPTYKNSSIGVRYLEMNGGHRERGFAPFWWWPGELVAIYDPDGNY